MSRESQWVILTPRTTVVVVVGGGGDILEITHCSYPPYYDGCARKSVPRSSDIDIMSATTTG